ncbi:MAG: hypothetical protein ACRD2T_08165, partial [Thermoanaerobaculia bacterium]
MAGTWFLVLSGPLLLGHDGGPGFSTAGEGGLFIRGDADQNGVIGITDAVSTLGFLFFGAEEPYCHDALDANDDGAQDITDGVAILSRLFLGGEELPAPHPEAGIDPTADGLDCDNGRFAHIRRQILAVSCSSFSCHSSVAAKGGLVLEGMRAYS